MPRYDDEYEDDDARPYGRLEPHRGTTILVLGILGIVVCGVLAPFAWVMGGNDLKKMAAGQMDPSGRGETQAGYYCGIAGTILLLLTVVGGVMMIALMAAAAGGAGK